MTSTARGRLWALTATHAANDFYPGAVAALLPYFIARAGYSYAAAAGITLAATALSSVAQPAFGHLSDRYGLRWLSLAGLLCAGAGVALSGVAGHSYPLVLAVVALSGIGVAAYHPAATVEARLAGSGSSGAMSLFSVGGNVGTALAPSAVVLAVGRLGLPGTVLLALPALVLGAVYFSLARKGMFRRVVATEKAAVAGPGQRDSWSSFAWLTAVLALWSIAYVGTTSFVALYSIARFGSTPSDASLALSVFPAAGAVGTLAGGRLADRLGRLAVIRSGYALAALSVGAIVLAPSPAVVVVATGCVGIALFLPFSAQITLSHTYLPNRIGLASGVTLGLTLSLGGVVSPLLGALADAASVRTVFVLIGLLTAGGFALSFTLRERERVLAGYALP
ncbi:MFS transporter [Amycolatopsis sacchari]|uniref:MFS transporter n=1 Tax=Amycolatopsis sacchari TaxID=115433 RepID=UPI003EBC4AAC